MTGQDSQYNSRVCLLEAFLKAAPFDGWNPSCLKNAAKSMGLSEFELHRLFPEGSKQFTRFFIDEINSRHRAVFEAKDIANLRHHEKVRAAVIARIELLASNKEAIRAFAAFAMNPFNVDISTYSVSSAVDLIWRMVGDKSTDFSFYTKRASLGAIYSKTMLFWLSDDSAGFLETCDFLERQLDSLMAFHKVKSRLKEKLGF